MLAVLFVIDLPDLGGREKIEALGVPVRTLISFEGRRSHRPHPEEARSRGLSAVSKDEPLAQSSPPMVRDALREPKAHPHRAPHHEV